MENTVFAPSAEAESRPSRWPLRENVFADRGEGAHGEPEDRSWQARESGLASQEAGLEAEGKQPGSYEWETEGYGPLAEDHQLPASPVGGWGHEGWDREGQGKPVPC